MADRSFAQINSDAAATVVASPDIMLVSQGGILKGLDPAVLLGSGLTVKSAAGSAATTGMQVGAATAGLFSGGSGATEYVGLSANGAEVLRVGVGGHVRIGTTTDFSLPSSRLPRLHIIGGDYTLLGSASGADGATKNTRIGSLANTIAQLPLCISNSQATGSANLVNIGGGTSTMQAATSTSLYAASAINTATGTELLRATTAGVRIQSGVSAAASDIFHVYSNTLTADILRCSDSLGTVGIGGAPIASQALTIYGTGTHLRLRYDGSNLATVTVSSAGLVSFASSGTGPGYSFGSSGVTASGINRHVTVADTTAVALGVGAAVRLDGVYTGTTQTGFAAVKGYKETVTDGEYGGHLDLYSRTNGSNLAANLRVAASGRTLVRPGITTQTPSAQLHAIQSAAAGAIPVLELEQDDADQPFVEFDGTEAADTTASVSTLTTSGAVLKHIQCTINGTKGWIAFLDNPS